MSELIRLGLNIFARTGLFLSVVAGTIAQYWSVEYTGQIFDRPYAVMLYNKGVLASHVGLETLPSELKVVRREAGFDPRVSSAEGSMLHAVCPAPGQTFLWSGDIILGFRHHSVICAFGILCTCLVLSSRRPNEDPLSARAP